MHTIVQYLRELGADCDVRDRTETSLGDVDAFDGVLLSPGPGRPEEHRRLPRHSAHGRARTRRLPRPPVIATVFGGTVARAPQVVHGYTAQIHHDGEGVFHGLPDPFTATRYHSLALDPETVPPTSPSPRTPPTA